MHVQPAPQPRRVAERPDATRVDRGAGGFVVAHFAFGPQKEYLAKEAAPVLAAYAALAGV